MSTRDKLLADYIAAARALVGEGLSELDVEKARMVDQALAHGADLVLLFNTGTATVRGVLAHRDPAVDPLELFRIEIAETGASN